MACSSPPSGLLLVCARAGSGTLYSVSRGPAAAACGHAARQTVEPGKQTPMAPQQLLVAILPSRKQGVVRRAQSAGSIFHPCSTLSASCLPAASCCSKPTATRGACTSFDPRCRQAADSRAASFRPPCALAVLRCTLQACAGVTGVSSAFVPTKRPFAPCSQQSGLLHPTPQSVDSWMQKQNLPRRLQRRIKTFYAEVGPQCWGCFACHAALASSQAPLLLC